MVSTTTERAGAKRPARTTNPQPVALIAVHAVLAVAFWALYLTQHDGVLLVSAVAWTLGAIATPIVHRLTAVTVIRRANARRES